MGFIYAIVNGFVKAVSEFGILLLSILPDSPLKLDGIKFLNNDLLAYINWIVPIPFMIRVGGAWLGCIALWYTVSVGLRWVKVID